MFPGHPEHLRTFGYIGLYRYSLRFSTHAQRQIFTCREVVDLILEQFSRSATEQQFAILAYCFMPDYVHLLVEGQAETSDCKRFIARAKQYSGFYYLKQYRDRLWQRYGFERVLRNEEITMVVARYILANPVRGGLVDRVEDYPFSGSLVYTLQQLLEGVSASSSGAWSG